MIRAKHNIRHDDVSYKKGALIEGLSKVAEQRLVDLKAADYVITPEEELQKQKVQAPPPTYTPDEFAALVKGLDENYNAEELKRAAKDVGVDLKGASKKEEVISAIINQGKADELLEDEENLFGEEND